MSETREGRDPTMEPCDYCGGPVGEEGVGSGTCEGCWYGMRLVPEEWEQRLREAGRAPTYQGGCVHVPLEGGGYAIACRNGFLPATTAAVEKARGRRGFMPSSALGAKYAARRRRKARKARRGWA